jgi:hypothetical protein
MVYFVPIKIQIILIVSLFWCNLSFAYKKYFLKEFFENENAKAILLDETL